MEVTNKIKRQDITDAMFECFYLVHPPGAVKPEGDLGDVLDTLKYVQDLVAQKDWEESIINLSEAITIADKVKDSTLSHFLHAAKDKIETYMRQNNRVPE